MLKIMFSPSTEDAADLHIYTFIGCIEKMEWSWSLNKKLLVVRVESDAEVCGVTNAHRKAASETVEIKKWNDSIWYFSVSC